MKKLVFLLFLISSIKINAQTVGITLARTYANAAIVKTYGRDNVKEINIEIIEWDYNASTDRLSVYFRATYKTWYLYWASNDEKVQLKCNLDGSSAEMKFDGMFNGWNSLGSLR